LIENLITEINDLGWHLYSCHQTKDIARADCWQITLREITTESVAKVVYAQGHSISSTLAKAIDKIHTATETINTQPTIYEGSLEQKPDFAKIILKLSGEKPYVRRWTKD
jgi:hypothetical protein